MVTVPLYSLPSSLRPSTLYSPSGGDAFSSAVATGVRLSVADPPAHSPSSAPAETVDHRSLVAPIDHQHLAGVVPAAVELVLADPPGQPKIILVLIEGQHPGIFAAARIGAA